MRSTLSEEMTLAHPNFQLAEFIAPDGLTGRNCGADLPLGIAFNTLRRVRYEGDVEHLESTEVEAARTISLKINRIQAYGKTLDILPSGLTGLLKLSGDGLDQIRDYLRDLPEREYLSIEQLP
jgi:hypothetical protein